MLLFFWTPKNGGQRICRCVNRAHGHTCEKSRLCTSRNFRRFLCEQSKYFSLNVVRTAKISGQIYFHDECSYILVFTCLAVSCPALFPSCARPYLTAPHATDRGGDLELCGCSCDARRRGAGHCRFRQHLSAGDRGHADLVRSTRRGRWKSSSLFGRKRRKRQGCPGGNIGPRYETLKFSCPDHAFQSSYTSWAA